MISLMLASLDGVRVNGRENRNLVEQINKRLFKRLFTKILLIMKIALLILNSVKLPIFYVPTINWQYMRVIGAKHGV